MSEGDSFLQEVTEEVRRDQLVATLRKNAVWIALAVIVVVGGAALFEWQKSKARTEAQANGDALWASLQEEDPAARAATLAGLDLSDEARPIAVLQASSAQVSSGDVDAAVAGLQGLAADPSISLALRDVARLKLAAISVEALSSSERLDLLERLTVEGHAMRSLALEQRALIHLQDGNLAAARDDLSAVADDPLAPQGARARADQLLTALGIDPAAATGSDG